MAVPLIDKGVVVVAVGYDIAPKGSLSIFDSIVSVLSGEKGWFKNMNWKMSASCCDLSFQVTWTWWYHKFAGVLCLSFSSILTSGSIVCFLYLDWIVFLYFFKPDDEECESSSSSGLKDVILKPPNLMKLYLQLTKMSLPLL